MAAKARWLLEIPSIVEQLMSLNTPVVDRAICERMFRVQRRRAIDLMQRFGGYRSGNTVLLNRLDLIRRLQEMATDPDIEQEHERKRRLSDHLVKLEKYRRAAAVQIHVSPAAANGTAADLPASISFAPGRLTVQYNSVEELLTRLYELAQAAANDFDRFTASAGGSA